MRAVLRIGRAAMRPIAVLAPLAVILASGCMPPDDGYDKVVVRNRGHIPAVAMPDPPPVTAGAAGVAGAGPIVVANLPAGVTQEMVNDGQQLYGTVCVACHGGAGAGGPVGPTLNDQEWIHITGQYEEIVSIINSGVPQPRQYPAPMPPQGGGNFTDEQVRSIAAYVYALSHQGGT